MKEITLLSLYSDHIYKHTVSLGVSGIVVADQFTSKMAVDPTAFAPPLKYSFITKQSDKHDYNAQFISSRLEFVVLTQEKVSYSGTEGIFTAYAFSDLYCSI